MNHIIYHDNCMDGFGALVVAAMALGAETCNPVAGKYGQSYTDFTSPDSKFFDYHDTVYILDFSVEPSILVGMCEKFHKVVWLDHHKTAIDKWKLFAMEQSSMPNNLLCGLDMTRSGTGITWDYFFPHLPRPRWVDMIEDRDLWRFNYPSTKQFHAGLSSYDKSIPVWNWLLGNEDRVDSIIADGAAILRAHNQRVKEICDGGAIPITIDGQEGLAANCSGYYASDVGHELAERSGTFGATWYQAPSGNIKWSLRARTPSDAPIDVAEIAKKFGGGGHKSAAGFTIRFSAADEGYERIELRSQWESADALNSKLEKVWTGTGE